MNVKCNNEFVNLCILTPSEDTFVSLSPNIPVLFKVIAYGTSHTPSCRLSLRIRHIKNSSHSRIWQVRLSEFSFQLTKKSNIPQQQMVYVLLVTRLHFLLSRVDANVSAFRHLLYVRFVLWNGWKERRYGCCADLLVATEKYQS